MRGEVLHYDEAQGFGFIAGVDGNRYTFRREDLRRAFPVSKGTLVEFRESGGQARDIFSIRDEAPVATPTMAPAAAAPATTAAPRPQHFGRFAVSGSPASTGLWSYFWEGITSNYANFRGRARRKEYWGFYLFWGIWLIVALVPALILDLDAALDAATFDSNGVAPIWPYAITGLFFLATVVPCIAMTVRRFHDVGLSGWFYLLFLVLAFITIGGLIILIIGLIPSQKHDNKWGPVPAGIRIPPPYSPAPSTAGTEQ